MNERDVALLAARAAAAILSEKGSMASRLGAGGQWRQRVQYKGVVDPVTEIDLACESAVRRVLEQQTPDIPILGEEEGGALHATTRWVLDPLDGTVNFLHGFPSYAVSLALEVDGVAEVGVVIDPLRQREYTAQRGAGAWCGDFRLQVSDCRDLNAALVATGFAYDRRTKAQKYLSYVKAVMERVEGIRRAGAASMDLVMLACGQLDAYWEFSLSTWDVAAGILLVEEAGGKVSSHSGGPIERDRPSPLGSNGFLHEQMMKVLEEVAEQ